MEHQGEELPLVHLLQEGQVDLVQVLAEHGPEIPHRLMQVEPEDEADGLGHGRKVEGRWSWVMGHGSWVVSLESRLGSIPSGGCLKLRGRVDSPPPNGIARDVDSRPKTRRPKTLLNHEIHTWHSPVLGREMTLQVIGHAGARVLVFPTSMGTHSEWPDRRMHQVLQDHIDQGWIQLFCLDQPHHENWGNEAVHAGHRAWVHLQYYRYVRDEVLPFTASKNNNSFVITTGASLGATHAAAFGLRYPESVSRIIGHERALRPQAPDRRIQRRQSVSLQSHGFHAARA